MSDHSKSSPLKTYFAVWAALLLRHFHHLQSRLHRTRRLQFRRRPHHCHSQGADRRPLLYASQRRQRETTQGGSYLHHFLSLYSVSAIDGRLRHPPLELTTNYVETAALGCPPCAARLSRCSCGRPAGCRVAAPAAQCGNRYCRDSTVASRTVAISAVASSTAQAAQS